MSWSFKLKRRNSPVKFTPDKFLIAVVLSWATYHSVKLIILDL
jgi:hypothetical protein